MSAWRNPAPTVDLIIEQSTGSGQPDLVFVRRSRAPLGWALPGGFVDYGESAETAAVREAKEETGLDVRLIGQLGVYSDPDRDPRGHTLTVVFVARATGTPLGGDDAAEARLFRPDCPPAPLCFDHARIVTDYLAWRDRGRDRLQLCRSGTQDGA